MSISKNDVKSLTYTRKARGRPRGWKNKSHQNTIKSLERAMEVFEFLSEGQGMPLTQLATELNQSPATLYRILITLEKRGLVEFDHVAQLWHIGPRSFVIGARFIRRTNLVERARPIMRKLMEDTGETANLGVQQDNSVLFLSQVETQASIRAFFPPGTLSPMHASGIGKALLAHMDELRLNTLLSKTQFERFTAYSITEPTVLRAHLSDIRTRGYSIDNEEKNTGMRCIAAPVFDFNREAIAGISVSGPTSRIEPARLEELIAPVMNAAQDLTFAIGGNASAHSH